MNIIYASDDNYAPLLGVSMFSLCMNNQQERQICFYILDDQISSENKAKLMKTAEDFRREIIFIDVTEIVDRLRSMDVQPWRGGYTAYLKVVAGSFLPASLERAICIDADTVVGGSLHELSVMELNEFPCAMAYECINGKYPGYLGIKDGKYYNTGVIVYNFPKWKKMDVEGQFFSHLKNICHSYYLPEQDPLSIVLEGKICTLSPKFNFLAQHHYFQTRLSLGLLYYSESSPSYYSVAELKEAEQDVRIFHMIDTFTLRPWQKGNIHPFTQRFDYYMKQSRWNDLEKQTAVKGVYAHVKFGLRKYLPPSLSNCYFSLCNNLFYANIARNLYKNRRLIERSRRKE